MNLKSKSKNKIITIIIIIVICIMLFPFSYVNAEVNNDTYTYNNYNIKYTVSNVWDNHQNIEIQITNTGNETIYNWALGYDAGGNISNVWNGTIYNSNGTNYIIKNAEYNYEILPGNSVTFGYTLQGEKLATPDNFELCSKRIEINDGYNTQLVIEDKWETGFSGYIEILNESDIPFEAWMLSFDTNFVISDLWNAIIVENEDNTYKVSSQIMSNPISSGSSIKIGITASFEEGVEPVITKELISIVQIDDSILNNIKENIIDNSDEIVGKMYFKDLASEDDIICDSDGNHYFKNQILITAYDGVSFDKINDLAHSIDAEIVGYIELTNDYQIEFNYDISIDEMINIINNLSENQIIELVTPNIVCETTCDSFPNDTIIQPQNNISIHNKNWNLYAINVVDAWDLYNNIDNTNAVKIGVIDSMFFLEHDDVSFKKTWNNPNNLYINDDHGTLTSGIIGANHNNQEGIAGICPKAELYGYSFYGNNEPDVITKATTMKIKYCISLLIGNNIKVVNVSLSLFDKGKYSTTIIEHHLNKLLNKGYDFVIVCSAGNKGTATAKNNSYFSNIDKSSPVYNHIIVVGAVTHQMEMKMDPITHMPITPFPQQKTDSHGNLTLECEYKKNSNYDDRVDIVAPGENIYSTSMYDENGKYGTKNYLEFFDTSAAAPQVAGVAGMLYSINPNLKGSQVKEMIINSAKESANTNPNRKIPYNGLDYYLLDAKAAVDMAMSLNGPFLPSIENNEAIVYGIVTDVNDEPVENAKIKIKSTTSSTTVIPHFKTDENGEYLITLKPDTYNMTFSINDESFFGWHYNEDYAYHTIKNKEITVDKEGYNNAYPLDIKLDNKTTESIDIFDDSNGVSISDVIATIKAENGSSQTVTLNSSELSYNDVEDGIYTISLSKDGYIPATIQVNAMGGNIYDQNGEILEKITLIPIEASIYGTVTRKNLTTGEVSPKSGHTVKILKNGEDFTSVTTQDDGTYRVLLNEYGDYTVIFDEEHQNEASIATNIDYELNCEFEYEEDDENDDSEDDENDNSDNNGDDAGENNSSDPWSTVVEDEFILPTAVDDPSQDASNDNVNVSGDYSVNLKDGIYVDCGEYTYHYYVADDKGKSAEIWTAFLTNRLMYDVYKDGELIKSKSVRWWYKRIVSSYNYKAWIHTEYVSSVGIKKVEKDGEYKVYLTYTVRDTWNPNVKTSDTIDKHSIYLTGGSDIEVSVRNK